MPHVALLLSAACPGFPISFVSHLPVRRSPVTLRFCHLFLKTVPAARSPICGIKSEFLIFGIRLGLSHQTVWMAVSPYLGSVCVWPAWQTLI